MTGNNFAIRHDFASDKVTDTSAIERAGMSLMRLAAKATAPVGYTGLSILVHIIRTILPSSRMIRTHLSDDADIEFTYGDLYWSRLLDTSQPYSYPEETFLKAISKIDYAYMDAGANFGYMSLLISSQDFGRKPAIAIEADQMNFSMLHHNWDLNGRRFDIRNNAIFSKSGKHVKISGGKHEARAITRILPESKNSDVKTLALDGLAEWYGKTGARHLVIKLDVEGVEIDALQGATKLLEQDPCILYEDHGNENGHDVTRYLMRELGMRVFYFGHKGHREILEPGELDAIKSNPRLGYDFIAVRGNFWPSIVSSLLQE